MSVKVFLSGAIEDVGIYAFGWRKKATEFLNLAGYTVLDPTSITDDGYESPQEIVAKNLFMQSRADLILVEYMIPGRAYIGTDFELSWAKFNSQPAIVFCCEENKDRVYLKYLATKLAFSLEDAIEYIVTNYPSN